MNFYMFFGILASAFVAFIIIHKISKNKRPVRRAFLSMLSGAAALALVDVSSVFTGVYLPLSLLTIIVSLVSSAIFTSSSIFSFKLSSCFLITERLGLVTGCLALLAVNLFF